MKMRLVSLGVLGFVFLTGCGGGMSQDDLMKYARKGRPDEGSDEESSSKPPPPKPTVSQQAHLASTPPVNPSPVNASQLAGQNLSANDQPSIGRSDIQAVTELAGETLSDTIPASTKLSLTERRQKTLDNLERINQALETYVAQNRRYPPHAIYNQAGTPTLSWRVALLPYLGYQELYEQFDLEEPWNGPNNFKLLSMIPSVYQSPERFDTRTNYLVPVGTSTAFFGKQGKIPRRWEDGVHNTVVLVEANDELATEWTRPSDLDVDVRNPSAGLGGLRQDGLFVLWGGGRLSRIEANESPKNLKAMFTIDGGESLAYQSISRAAVATLSTNSQAAASQQPINSKASVGSTQTAVTTAENARTASSVAPAMPRSELVEKAQFAFQSGREDEAVDLAYIGFLTEQLDPLSSYKWIPALRRPASFVRFGIIVDYRGVHLAKLKQMYPGETKSGAWSSQRALLKQIVGDIGEPLIEVLKSHEPFAPAELLHGIEATQQTTKRNRNRESDQVLPCVTLLGAGNVSKMLRYAKQRGMDLALIFEVDEHETRGKSKKINKAVIVKLHDVERNKVVYKSPPVRYNLRDLKLKDPLFEDPIDQTIQELGEFLEEQLHPQPLPSKLQPKHALARANLLAKRRLDDPLPRLAEINFYRTADLLSLGEAHHAFQSIINDSDALRLLAGTQEERLRVLKEYMPTIEFPVSPSPYRRN